MLRILPQDKIVLRTPTEPVHDEFFGSEECMKLYYKMVSTMRANGGVGLAAPQIGVSNSIFVIENGDLSLQGHAMFINPKLTLLYTLSETTMEEGCLSIPNAHFNVPRADKIKLEYRSFDGRAHSKVYTGFKARVVQHEMDHLFGKLICDYAVR